MRRAFTASIYARNCQQVLLVFHKRFDLWVPVGGELEPGETPLEAAKRELYEETGLEGTFPKCDFGAPDGFLHYEEHDAASKGWHMNFAFVADVPTQKIVPCDEFTKYQWFNFEDVANIPAPPNVKALVPYVRYF